MTRDEKIETIMNLVEDMSEIDLDGLIGQLQAPVAEILPTAPSFDNSSSEIICSVVTVEELSDSLIAFVRKEVKRNKRAGNVSSGANDAIKRWFRKHSEDVQRVPLTTLTETLGLVEYYSEREEIVECICKGFKRVNGGITVDQFVALIKGIKLKSMRGDLAEEMIQYLSEKQDKDDLLNEIEPLLSASQRENFENRLMRPNSHW